MPLPASVLVCYFFFFFGAVHFSIVPEKINNFIMLFTERRRPRRRRHQRTWNFHKMFGQSCLWCHFIILALYSSCVRCLLHTQTHLLHRAHTHTEWGTRYGVRWWTLLHAVHDLLLIFVSHLSHFMECILLVFVGSCQFFVPTDTQHTRQQIRCWHKCGW